MIDTVTIVDWTHCKEITTFRTILTATFKLSAVEIYAAYNAESIYIDGRHYRVPVEALKSAMPGMVKLELEEIDE